jgi:hypothetical protein
MASENSAGPKIAEIVPLPTSIFRQEVDDLEGLLNHVADDTNGQVKKIEESQRVSPETMRLQITV